MTQILSCENIILQKGAKKILQGVSLEVPAGRNLALIGPNGAGKSSLLQVLSLLTSANSGDVSFKGQKVAGGRQLLEVRRRMAVVFQQPLLLNTTVEENLAIGLKYRRVRAREISKKVDEWLEVLRISHLKTQNAWTLSGGEAQRVNLARALITDPEMLFMDEPFSALDAPSKAELMEDLRQIIKENKLSSIFVTHDYNEIPFLASHVAVILQGQIAQIGTVRAVFDKPSRKEIAALVGYENLLPGKVEEVLRDGSILNITGKAFKVKANARSGQNALVCLRGREVHLAKQEGEFKERDNILQGKITKILPYGEQLKLDVDCGIKLTVALPQSKLFESNLHTGNSVFLRIPPSAPHLILTQDSF